MADPELTDEQKVRIAQEVLEGKRDPADLEKYGIRLGEPVQISPAMLLAQAEAERRKQKGPVEQLFEKPQDK